MNRKIAFLLIACTLLLTACTKDKTMQPVTSPTTQATSTPEVNMSPVLPSASNQPAMTDSQLQDGNYSAEVSESYASAQGHGWKEYLKITVTNNQISSVEYDALKDNKKKSEATAEAYPMTPPPSEWIPKINDAIRAAEVPEAMDTVSGATMSSTVARQLYAAVLKAAREGNTETVVVDIT